jgi:DNA polymerase III subunit epsilon
MSIEGARQAAIKNARSILDEEFVIIDTETTGLHDAQVIELGIIDKHGNQLYSGRFQTDAVIEPYATAVHGISSDDLEGQLHFRDVAAQISTMIAGKAILGYNVNFDVRALRNSLLAAGQQMPDLGEKYDVMTLYAQYHGEKNAQGWKKKRLVDAAKDFGYKTTGAHNATTDCHLVLAVLQGIADQEHDEDFAPEPVDDGFVPVEI